MPCWVAIAPLMGSTTGWRHTESTGRYPKTIRSPRPSITSAKAVKRSIVGPRARSRWQFPCVASGSDQLTESRALEGVHHRQLGQVVTNLCEEHVHGGRGRPAACVERLALEPGVLDADLRRA